MKTFSIISLGCFRNSYDSGIIKEQFLRKGYLFKEDPQGSQTLIINTCGFIDPAKKESLEVITRAVELKKKGKVRELIIGGCLVKRYQEELKKSYPEVDRWRGVLEFSRFLAPRRLDSPAYSRFIKISEGCRNNCSFCAIPLIKGNLKSRRPEDILKEVEYLNKKGIKELNLIGQDITSWGKDLKRKSGLAGLLKKILKLSGKINWIRLNYTHPGHLNDELLELIAGSQKICKYIDLPIQHINDKILKAMNRKTSGRQIKDLIFKIRKMIPDCAIRTSVIVGFPGEGQKEFKQLLKFLKVARFDRLGAFSYSREEGTRAYGFKDQVHQMTKNRRYSELMDLQQEISSKLMRRSIGKDIDVLVEEKQANHYFGRTQYDAPQVDGGVFINRPNLKAGEFCRVKIVDAYEYDLIAV